VLSTDEWIAKWDEQREEVSTSCSIIFALIEDLTVFDSLRVEPIPRQAFRINV